jgi:hypothetical protein
MHRIVEGRRGLIIGLVVGAIVASAGTAGASALITGKQIKDGSITKKDLSRAVRAELAKAGAPGPTGPQGPQGSKGDPGPSTGPASGDLTGQFPAPSLGNGVVNAAKFGTIQMVTNEQVLPTAQSTQLGVQCPDGAKLISGGGISGLLGVPISGSAPGNSRAWQVIVRNDSGVSAPVKVWALCLVP